MYALKNYFQNSFNLYIFRLSAEMNSLRRVYEEQIEKAKSEYMNLHSQKVFINTKDFFDNFFL